MGSLDKNGERHGEGTFTWDNGDKYEGEYLHGKRDGNGTFTWDKGDKYVGHYLNGKRDGKGRYTWGNGDKYEGEYKYGKRQGDGTLTYTTGDRLEGIWENDELQSESDNAPPTQPSVGKEDDSTASQASPLIETSPDSPPPAPETSPEVQIVEIIVPPPEEELPPLPGEPVEIPSFPGEPVEIPPLPGEPVEIPPPPIVEIPPLPGEPVEIAPPPSEIKENVTTWKGTQEEAENYLESRERGEVSALHVKETGKPFEGTIIIVLEDGSKQGQVTVIDGLLHGEEILWGEDGEILERNRYENGKLVAEEIIPQKE